MTFQHKGGVTFGVSRKVMSTFFENNSAFQRVKVPKVDYFIARNPYDRAVSLWADKCGVDFKFPFQPNQKILAGAAHCDESKLNELSFLEFARLLHKIWDLNDHFRPQTYGIPGFFKYAGIVIMLEHRDFPILEGVDWSVKENASVHKPFNEHYCNESTNIIRRIYQFDFQILGYPF